MSGFSEKSAAGLVFRIRHYPGRDWCQHPGCRSAVATELSKLGEYHPDDLPLGTEVPCTSGLQAAIAALYAEAERHRDAGNKRKAAAFAEAACFLETKKR